MNQEGIITLTVKHRFDQSPERVFDAWLDADSARHWLFATDKGEMLSAEVDARVGGGFRFIERRDGEDVEHVGEYLVIDRPHRLVFTFAVPKYSADAATVTVDITEQDGGTELTLTQQMNVSHAGWKEATEQGWAMILGNLAKNLEVGQGTASEREADE